MARDKLYAEVVIAGSYKQLSAATKGAQKEMKGLGDYSKKVSKVMKGAIVGAALLGLNMLYDGLVKVTKEAAKEAESMAVLDSAMKKSWKATSTLGKEQEKFITKMAYMAVVQDDVLRPAYAKIVRVTKSAAKAQKAFTLSLDIAAATGKDVSVVSQAMAKYLAGNKTAFDKLVPGIKNAANGFQFLTDKYGGTAKIVGDQKPFEKIQLIFSDIQERLGAYILPYVKQFADYLAGPEAQKMIEDMFGLIQKLFDYFQSPDGQAAIQAYADTFKQLTTALQDIGKWFADNKALIDFLKWSTGIAFMPLQLVMQGIAAVTGGGQAPAASAAAAGASYASPGAGTVYNINVSGVSGSEVVKAIRREAGARGIPASKMLGI